VEGVMGKYKRLGMVVDVVDVVDVWVAWAST
jgi:hypothetical protein